MAIQQVGAKTALKVLGDVIRYRIRPSVRHLILHVTNVCNMRCQHCFVNFEELVLAGPHEVFIVLVPPLLQVLVGRKIFTE